MIIEADVRVEYIGKNKYFSKGTLLRYYDTEVEGTRGSMPVDWDDMTDGHKCGNDILDIPCRKGHGWYVPHTDVKIIK